jgi:hypothetical protein
VRARLREGPASWSSSDDEGAGEGCEKTVGVKRVLRSARVGVELIDVVEFMLGESRGQRVEFAVENIV